MNKWTWFTFAFLSLALHAAVLTLGNVTLTGNEKEALEVKSMPVTIVLNHEKKKIIPKTKSNNALTKQNKKTSVDKTIESKKDAVSNDALRRIAENIKENLQYPKSSKRRRETGIVKIGFVLTPAGNIEDIQVLRGCKFEKLNMAAINAAQETAKSIWKVGSLSRPLRLELELEFSELKL